MTPHLSLIHISAKDAVLASVGEVVTEVYMNTATFRNMIAADEVKNRFMTVPAKANAVLLLSLIHI